MNTLTTEEIQIVKRAVGLLEVDFNTFRENLIRDQMMTSGEAHNFAEKALTARVIQIAQGRVRMTPPPPDPRALSDVEIHRLEKLGYRVQVVYDGDPPRYAWHHIKSGAAQSDLNGLQPSRRTRAQAWVDCRAYDSGDVPISADPDWLD